MCIRDRAQVDVGQVAGALLTRLSSLAAVIQAGDARHAEWIDLVQGGVENPHGERLSRDQLQGGRIARGFGGVSCMRPGVVWAGSPESGGALRCNQA